MRPLSSFVGRDRERAMVRHLLCRPDVRLLTLTGPGGVGKTRLALSVMAALEGDFPDGIRFVSLAAITDEALVPAAIARTLGLREASGRGFTERLTAHLREASTLLVLDNLEQVVSAAPSIAELLASCRSLKVLATSRVMLRITGEHELVVPPLACPDRPAHGRRHRFADLTESPAVALFVQRARAIHADLPFYDDQADAVAEICRRLDGLPLAIELAAVRTKLLPPAAMVERLSDRFALLTGGPWDQPPRLRTMRDAIEWSYDLLSERERELFARLSAFAGGFTLEAAEAVLGHAILDDVACLLDNSLLWRLDGADGRPRFSMLETIRAFGLERLRASGEAAEIRQRHARYFLQFAEAAAAWRTGAGQAAWLRRLDAEHDNLRAALAWLRDHPDPGCELRLASSLWAYWMVRGYLTEGRGWLEGAIERARGRAQVSGRLADALYGAAWLALEGGDDRAASALGQESLARARAANDQATIARALGTLGCIAELRGNRARATVFHGGALALRRSSGDRSGTTVSLTYLGHLAASDGDVERASTLLHEALAIERNLDRPRNIAWVLANLGFVAYHGEDLQGAEAFLLEALQTFRDLGDLGGLADVLNHLTNVASRRGDLRRAWDLIHESLPLCLDLGDVTRLAACLESVSSTAGAGGHHRDAARLLAAATTLRTTARRPRSRILAREAQSTAHRLRSTLGDAAFRDAEAVGRTLTLDDAIADAQAVINRLGTAPPAPEPDPRQSLGLTPREGDVLRLLSRRLTDREIADALFVSPRTVHHHVASILAKLDVRSRRDAAAVALGFGIT